MKPTPDIPPRERRELVSATANAEKYAGELRANMSSPEVLLWTRLRSRGVGFSFRRQKALGPYVADFYCHELLLVIEVDGATHGFRGVQDRERDGWLHARGISTVRIPAADVLGDLTEAAAFVHRSCLQRAEQLGIVPGARNARRRR